MSLLDTFDPAEELIKPALQRSFRKDETLPELVIAAFKEETFRMMGTEYPVEQVSVLARGGLHCGGHGVRLRHGGGTVPRGGDLSVPLRRRLSGRRGMGPAHAGRKTGLHARGISARRARNRGEASLTVRPCREVLRRRKAKSRAESAAFKGLPVQGRLSAEG